MKKNLIFKLCFIVGIFLIILTACDLGTNNRIKRANITFSLEGPVIEQVRANSRASNSARYIHPNANYLIFELFSGEKRLDTQTISIKSGTKSISITVKGVPLNDPNLRAEIKVWGNGPTQGADLLGQNSIHLGRIGLGYTKLSLGVKPAGNFETVKYEDDEYDGIYLDATDYEFVWEIKMLSQKGLYTIVAQQNDLVLYASDGRQYKNTHSIKGQDGYYTLVFYHPENKASTYYLASSSGNEFSINSGTKLEQEILVTQKSDETDTADLILDNLMPVEFETVSGNSDVTSETLSFTIYNPYSQALNFTTKFENGTANAGTTVPTDSWEKFTAPDFPDSLPPGGRRDFDIIFDPKESGSFFADFTIQAEGLGNFVLELSGSGSGI